MSVASAQAVEASANKSSAPKSTGRLPNRSDSGPMMICRNAVMPRYPAIARLTRA